MSSLIASRARRLAFIVVATGWLVAGCYNPTIKGQFKCNGTYMSPFDCPDGTHCSAGFCVKGSPPKGDAGVDRTPDNKVEVHAETPSDTPPEVPPADVPDLTCTKPVASCTSDTGKLCDPVCQTGCSVSQGPSCHDKCSVNTLGNLTCNPMSTATRMKGLLESCTFVSNGSAAQTDDCAPGLVCLGDGCNLPRCYHFCKTDNDCPTSTCSIDAGGGVKVCDVPAATCNPIKRTGVPDGCGTDNDTSVCYLSPKVPDRTSCDCPFMAGGPNTICSVAHDCFYGLVCVASQCRQACDLTSTVDCLFGSICTPISGSTKFGFCN